MTKRDDFDALVVGAGPAGSAAALVLARANRRVALLDARRFPRDKVCGDLIGADAVAALRELELADVLDGAFGLSGARLYGPSGRGAGVMTLPARFSGDETIKSPDAPAYMLPRVKLDERLVARAVDAGAELHAERALHLERRDDGAFSLATADRMLHAPVIVGADGYGSLVRRALGGARAAPRSTAIVARAYASGVYAAGAAMHFFVNPAGDGYGWVFPLGDGGANVGLGYVQGEPPARGGLNAAFGRFIGPDFPAASLLRTASVSAPKTWPIPLGPNPPLQTPPGVFLAGDAAALASPLSGSGIHHALRSGALAAAAALRQLAGDASAHHHYRNEIARRFTRRCAVEAFIHRWAGTAPRIGAFLTAFDVVPGANQWLARSLLTLG